MDNKAYVATALTGGTPDAVDGVNGNLLVDGDITFAFVGGLFRVYKLSATSGAAASVPSVIPPAANAGLKRWLWQNPAAAASVVWSYLYSKNVEALLSEHLAQINEHHAAISALQTGYESGILGYATKAAMDADLNHAANTIAYVTNDTTTSLNGIYRKIGASGAGSWTASNYDRVTALAAEMYALMEKPAQADCGDNAWGVADENGKSPLYVDALGQLVILGTILDHAQSKMLERTKTGALILSDLVQIETGDCGSDEKFALLDEEDRVVCHVTSSGQVIIADLASEPAAVIPEPPPPAEYNHYIGYGQSLSVGRWPNETSAQPYSNKTLGNGVWSGNTYKEVARSTALIPLIEPVADNYETTCSGMCNSVIEFIRDVSLIAPGSHVYDMIGTIAGKGGASAQQLSKGSLPYQVIVDQVSDAKTAAAAAGKTYELQAISWMQGEADIMYRTSRADYAALIAQLVSDLLIDLKNITNRQKFCFITYQVASNSRPDPVTPMWYPTIALAQSDLAANLANCYMACPMYMFDYLDIEHINGPSEYHVGGYFAKVYHQVVYERTDWKPLQPIAANTQGNICELLFHVPYGPLVFDSTLVAAVANYGFTAHDDTGDLPITSVSITGDDRVKFVFGRAPAANAAIRYAWGTEPTTEDEYATWPTGRTAGARGNLRDSDGDRYKMNAGTAAEYRLHNYCVIFEHFIN